MAWRILAGLTMYLLVVSGVVSAFRWGMRRSERAAELEAAKRGPRLIVVEKPPLGMGDALRRRGKRS